MRPLPTYKTPFRDSAEIEFLAERYNKLDTKNKYTDERALEAGRRITAGDLSNENIKQIYCWKLQSFYSRFEWVRNFPDPNAPDEIREALQVALDADGKGGPRAALSQLTALKYVGIPVASAIITAIYPERFTVIDRQAYSTLGLDKKAFPSSVTINEYLHYLEYCRTEARRFCVSLRNFDRALWQFGSDSGRKSKQNGCL